MKYLFASDIHGSAYWCERLIQAIEIEKPDQLVLLGDLLYHGPRNPLPKDYDPQRVAEMLNSIAPVPLAVRGNCDAEVDQMLLDFPCMADYIQLEILDSDGHTHRIFATHGHVVSPDAPPALDSGDIFAYGHTHIRQLETKKDIVFFNPGSVSLPKNSDGLHTFGTCDTGIFELKTLPE